MQVGLIAAPATEPRPSGNGPGSIQDTATQFESLLIGELLKSVRDSGGWLGSGENDQAGATMLEVAEQHLAQVLAAQGGLGLAGMVIQGLEKDRCSPAAPVR